MMVSARDDIALQIDGPMTLQAVPDAEFEWQGAVDLSTIPFRHWRNEEPSDDAIVSEDIDMNHTSGLDSVYAPPTHRLR